MPVWGWVLICAAVFAAVICLLFFSTGGEPSESRSLSTARKICRIILLALVAVMFILLIASDLQSSYEERQQQAIEEYLEEHPIDEDRYYATIIEEYLEERGISGEYSYTDDSIYVPVGDEWVDRSVYDDILDAYHSESEYYESLCADLGLLTYSDACQPFLLNYFVSNSDTVYHKDYLCPVFDRLSITTVHTAFDGHDEGPDKCSFCTSHSGDEACYLDIESGIYHLKLSCLSSGSSDYIHPDHIYCVCLRTSADEAGYAICPICSNSES